MASKKNTPPRNVPPAKAMQRNNNQEPMGDDDNGHHEGNVEQLDNTTRSNPTGGNADTKPEEPPKRFQYERGLQFRSASNREARNLTPHYRTARHEFDPTNTDMQPAEQYVFVSHRLRRQGHF